VSAPARPDRSRTLGWPFVAVTLAVFAVVTADVLGHAGLTRLDHRVADWAWAANFRHGNLPRALVIYAATMPGDVLGVCALFVPYVLVLAWARRTVQPIVRAAIGLGLVLLAVWALKAWIGRTAPGLVDALHAGGRSYPSGHSAVAVVTCGITAWLALDYGLPAGWTWLLRVVAVAGPLLTAAGMVLLVYHWLTDTLAGLAVGVVVLRVVHLVCGGQLGHWGDASRLDRPEPAVSVGGAAVHGPAGAGTATRRHPDAGPGAEPRPGPRPDPSIG
jgi:membrane-associated phospholipid phosphatase